MDAYIDYCYDNLNYHFYKSNGYSCSRFNSSYFRNKCKTLRNFNKKALYIFIRERTGLETTNITKCYQSISKQIYEDQIFSSMNKLRLHKIAVLIFIIKGISRYGQK
jgi:hypothetical protein